MLNNFKITGKLTIGFGIVLLLFGIAVFFSWQNISAVQSDVQYLQTVVDNTVKLAVELTNQISWIRACVRDLKFSESDEDIERLTGFMSGYPSRSEFFDIAERLLFKLALKRYSDIFKRVVRAHMRERQSLHVRKRINNLAHRNQCDPYTHKRNTYTLTPCKRRNYLVQEEIR